MSEVQNAIDAMTGRTILGGVLTDEGLHLWLDDGRVVLIIEAIIAVVEVDRKALQ